MSRESGRHEAVAAELAGCREDLCGGIGSRVVLLAVPPAWGRSAVLNQFQAVVQDVGAPVTLVVGIDGSIPPGVAVQAVALREALMTASIRSRLAELLGLDASAGRVQLALGVGGLFVSGLAAAASVLIASLALTAAGKAWDAAPAGEEGAVARAARAVAAVSVSVPVVVIIDDADRLDPGLARALITNLAGRWDGQVLVVVAADPGSDLIAALTSQAGYELAGRIQRAEADPGMGYSSRAGLAAELLPAMPAPAIERIARRTRTFKDVLAVASADRLSGPGPDTGLAAALAAVDAVIDARLDRATPSREAAALAWAGGVLPVRQADRALAVLDAVRQPGDEHVVRSGSLVRLADPASPRLAEQAAALSAGERSGLAAAVLAEAIEVAKDPDAGLVERVVARQAAHRVRGDLGDRGGLTAVQVALIRSLENLGDWSAACGVARTALDELPAGEPGAAGRMELLKAFLRLARTQPGQDEDPLIREAVGLAMEGGAAFGLEARIWAAVDLLARAGQREAALSLTDQVTTELETHGNLGPSGDQWRLLLAFHAGRAGHPAISRRAPGADDQHRSRRPARSRPGSPIRHRRPPRRHPPADPHPPSRTQHNARRRRRPPPPAHHPGRRLRHSRRLPPGTGPRPARTRTTPPPTRPRPPPDPAHLLLLRVLDRPGRGGGPGAAPVQGAAARPGTGPWPRPPRHPAHPQQHRVLDQRGSVKLTV